MAHNDIFFTLDYVKENFSFTEQMIDAFVQAKVISQIRKSSHGRNTIFYLKNEIENLANTHPPDLQLKQRNDEKSLDNEIKN